MSDDDEESVPHLDPGEPDWYLQYLVRLVNDADAEFPLTLYAGGLVISGVLASGRRYFESLELQFAELFERGGADDPGAVSAQLVTAGKQIYADRDHAARKAPPHYIHLRDARVFSAGHKPMPQEGTWWRGRIAEVDGFSFGRLVANPNGQ